jgi:hypothetical protein
VRILVLLLALAVSGNVLAQPAWKRDGGRERQMRQEDRERRERPPDRGRQMTPEERDKLRRDIENANRDLRRR